MPWIDTGLAASFFDVYGNGSLAQTTIPQSATAQLTNIPAGVPFDTGIVPSDGYRTICVGINSVVAGSLVVTRYLDRAGNFVVTTPLTTAVSAGTPTIATINPDNFPFSAFRITMTVTGGASSVITNFYVLLQAG